MSFQNNLCDLRVLDGEYVTAIGARSTSPSGLGETNANAPPIDYLPESFALETL